VLPLGHVLDDVPLGERHPPSLRRRRRDVCPDQNRVVPAAGPDRLVRVRRRDLLLELKRELR
jgi:hypothetical protein